MRTRLALFGLALAMLAATAGAYAQERWAVQVVALRDYREAQAAADDLRTLGFEAYTEFAMLDAQQWVRVRVGCFASREAADAMAEALRARITAQAQAVELSPGAKLSGCTQEVVGFLNAYGWRLVDDDGPVTFSVTVAGVPATVAHDDGHVGDARHQLAWADHERP
ncbi:MAG TPA: SPOR domain-containing protein [Trueperaceae bacterium]|nr:SPOR domain-containing protein [Trueperaceae bacterium]